MMTASYSGAVDPRLIFPLPLVDVYPSIATCVTPVTATSTRLGSQHAHRFMGASAILISALACEYNGQAGHLCYFSANL